LKAHILQLQTQLSDLKSHISSLELKQKNKESELQNNFNTQTKEKDQSWQSRIHELEVELINHRERSLKTLSDKDREVQCVQEFLSSTNIFVIFEKFWAFLWIILGKIPSRHRNCHFGSSFELFLWEILNALYNNLEPRSTARP